MPTICYARAHAAARVAAGGVPHRYSRISQSQLKVYRNGTCASRSYRAAMSTRAFNQPLGGNEMPRAGGPGTFMRLPSVDLASYASEEAAAEAAAELDVAILGIPLDTGTSFRTGTRFGPRQIRQESAMLRPYNMATRAAPFESLQVFLRSSVDPTPMTRHTHMIRYDMHF